MIISLPYLYLEIDRVIRVCLCEDEKLISTQSLFRWFKPSTWFLKPKETYKTEWIVDMCYCAVDDKYILTHQLTFRDSREALNTIKEINRQLKEQSNAQDRETLDRVFESALKESQ